MQSPGRITLALVHRLRSRGVAGGLVATAMLLALWGCTRETASTDGAAGRPGTDPDPGASAVVASVGERKFTAGEVDASIATPLHDLDYQRYLLRRQATEALLLREIEAGRGRHRTASIGLVPPRAPAVALPGAAAGLRPLTAAPVTVSVFCNFESPHCAGLQPVLADLRALYPSSVRVAARDLPLPLHPNAHLAAEAARCAGRQDRYWAFHDLLWARGRTPVRVELDAVAAVVGLDATEFGRCLDEHAESAAVAADAELGRDLGLAAVPAVFVNGRRATSPVTPDQLMWLIEDELQGVSPQAGTSGKAPPTSLPLVLRATIVGSRPGLGSAVIGSGSGQAGGVVSVRREGERVAPGAILRRATADGVELLVDGRIEILAFASATRTGQGDREAAGDGGPAEVAAMAVPGVSPMQVYLDREMVRELMADRVALSTQLKPQPLTVDGYRLLKLEEIPPGGLYELLGLQPGDVIVMVNEQPIHEGDNPLWDALDRDEEVRLRVMRRGGRAQHYTYRFQ